MRFLADESCDALIVRTLRDLGYDISYMIEVGAGATDQEVLAKALAENRILIAEDLDFGELVFRDQLPTYGIVVVRIPTDERLKKAIRITELINNHLEQLPGKFVILTLTNIRMRPLIDQE